MRRDSLGGEVLADLGLVRRLLRQGGGRVQRRYTNHHFAVGKAGTEKRRRCECQPYREENMQDT